MNQSLVQQMINYKINHITPTELVRLADDYKIQITKKEAQKVIAILKKEQIDLSNQKQINRILAKVNKEVSPKVMKQIQKLLRHVSQKK